MYVIKQCTNCKEYKLIDEFYTQKTGRFGKMSKCKCCAKKYRILRYIDPVIKIKTDIVAKNYYNNNLEKRQKYQKEYQHKKSEIKKQIRLKQKIQAQILKQNITHKKCKTCNNILEIKHFYKDRNRYRTQCKTCKYEYYYDSHMKSVKERLKKDITFKIIHRIRQLIRCSIKNQGYTKNSKTYEILGCDFDTFKKHIERQFTKRMTWENYGEWHFDHIYPISLGKTEHEIINLCHYTNFQPLWASDNRKKSNKIIEHQLKLCI